MDSPKKSAHLATSVPYSHWPHWPGLLGYWPFAETRVPFFATAPLASSHAHLPLPPALQVLQPVRLIYRAQGALFWRKDPEGGGGLHEAFGHKNKSLFSSRYNQGSGHC